MLQVEHVDKRVKENRIVNQKKAKKKSDQHSQQGKHLHKVTKSKRHVNWTRAYEDGYLEEYEDDEEA